MKKIGCMCLLLCLMQDVCARKMKEVFADMPDSVLVMLTRNNRLDCIDFIENNMPARVRNIFDSYSELTALTDDYLSMALTASSRVDMKLLPVNDSVQVVCMVRTYNGPVPESTVALYDADWNKIDRKSYLKYPQFEDFWQKPDSLDEAGLVRLQHTMDLRCVTAVLSADAPVLTFTLQTGDLTEEGRKSVAPCLCELRFRWNTKEGFLPESPDARH